MKSVKKRGGNYQPLDIDKIHAVLEWACNGGGDSSLSKIRGVSVSEIEMRAKLHLHDKISTKQIHECLIRAAADLISEETPNYDQVAARLVWFAVRKEAFDSNIPPHLYGIIKSNIKAGFYTKELLQWYSEDEWDVINAMIDHRRDDLFKYAGAEQMRKKYLCQNRKTKKVYETFQIPYILVSATLFASYPKETRLQYVKDFYDLVSQHYISLPTPIMAGVRTKVKQFSSCTVIKCGDDLDSIKSSAAAIVDYASRKAGIGLDVSALRAVSQGVRNGDALTTGLIPFIKFMNGALKSVSQGGLRGASATVYYPGWHLEFENLIELKNNKGTDETRVRTLDYGVALNEFMYTRFVTGGVITLFSPEEVPDLYAAFYSPDKAKFAELYEKYERDDSKTKKHIPAVEYFTKLMTERFETGRIYIFHADTVNTHTPFVDPIYSSNLCLTGDTKLTVKNSDGDEYEMSLENFCEAYEFGGANNLLVKTFDHETNKVIWSSVSAAAHTATVTELIEIEDNGHVIRCTPEHKIFTKNRGYVEAQYLNEDDVLCTEI